MRHLPHWRQDGASYFATFRLCDSLPQDKLHELHQLRKEWKVRHPMPYSRTQLDELSRETMLRVERWLDQGRGSCLLRDPRAARLVTDSMHYFDLQRYELGCYVVMPNHVHAIVRPFTVGWICNPSQSRAGSQELCLDPKVMDGSTWELEGILQSWKRHTARTINKLVGLHDSLWQQESFDRIIRDEEHLWRAIQYIGANPFTARLTVKQCPRWIRPEWVELGWKFEERDDRS